MNNNGFRFISLILLLAFIGFSTVFVEVADAHTAAEQAQANFNTLNVESERQERILSNKKLELRDLKQDEDTVNKWINGTADDLTDSLALAVASACDLSVVSSGGSAAIAARKAIEAANLSNEVTEIRQGIYDKETEVISQTNTTQTAITSRNNALKTWDQALGPGVSPTVEGVAILPLAVPPDYVRTIATRPILTNPQPANPQPDVTFYTCKGGCGLKGPREFSNTFLQYIGIPSHFVRHCQVVMHDDWKTYLVHGAPIKCGAAYYACEGRFVCSNAHNHPGGTGGKPQGVEVRASDHQHSHPHGGGSQPPSGSGSQPPTGSGSTPPTGSGSTPPSGGGSNPPPPPTDNTPNCQDCTTHCSSPCSCTNSGTCNGTVAAPPPPEPEPTLVACERGRGCAVRSSDGRACYVDTSRSACGHTYWSCNASAVSWHVTPHPCTRSGCDASYTNCSRGNGTCSAPHPKGGTYQWHGN